MRCYFTYIITNPGKTVLYTGITNDLAQRLTEHFLNRGDKKTFAGRYYCHFLLYFERFSQPMHAIEREKEIKSMTRKEKEALINQGNPRWHSLNSMVMDWPPHPEATSRG
ncbi:GIY-YIG nuclease family protein [Marinoscillum sp. MHG1-6]|uniref:GIY-YIG nuclease family protein n=1 Tax=Marinoscillum sp. MHG1-6 TaxID=2959627 RepID=UPI0021578FBB|nr:GIY-YIG nuclease family protein [Marinoscillum sp. MHG1-6]